MGGREEELCGVTRAEYIAIRWRGTSSVCECLRVPLFPGVGSKETGGGGGGKTIILILSQKPSKRNEI